MKSDRTQKAWLWATVLGLSGTAALGVARATIPSSLDSLAAIFLLFYLLPAIPILLLGALRTSMGLLLAVFVPLLWLMWLAPPDASLALWAIPFLSALPIAILGRRAARGSLPRPIGYLAIAFALTMLLWPRPGRPEYGPRVLLVGIDGATWKRLDPLLESDRMPHLARLLEHGKRADLTSLPSLYSPRIWSTIATGVTPEVHGIMDFGNQQQDLKVGRIWDELKREGRTIGTCAWYFTWPPLSGLGGNDFVVPSFLAPNHHAHPPTASFFWDLEMRDRVNREMEVSFAQALLRGFPQGLRLSTMIRAAREYLAWGKLEPLDLQRYWRSRRLATLLETDLFCHLLRTRRPEFATVLYTQVDQISHRYWKFMDPEGFPDVTPEEQERFADVISELYMQMDRNLGEILAAAPEDVDLLIVSDHGFRPTSRQLGGEYCRIRTEALIEALGWSGRLFGTNVDRNVFLRAIDSQAEAREEVLEKAASDLADARITGESRPLFRVQREGSSLNLHLAHTTLVDDETTISLTDRTYGVEDLIRTSRNRRGGAGFSGEHHPTGIFVLAGPSAMRAIPADSLHVLDIAPTLAALLELPVSPEWSGRPALKGLSLAEVEVRPYAAPHAAAAGAVTISDDLKAKLKSIGYLE